MTAQGQARTVAIYPQIGPTPLERFRARGWSLEAECRTCRRVTTLGADELTRRFGEHTTVTELFRRLRCPCGQGEPTIRAVIRQPPD